MRHAPMTALALVLGLAAVPAFAQSGKPDAPLGASAAAFGCAAAGAPLAPEAFNRLDDNGDGFISKQEYVEKCGKVGAAAQTDDAAAAHFAALDANRDSKLSADEFKSGKSADAAAGSSSSVSSSAPSSKAADTPNDASGRTTAQAPSGGSLGAPKATPGATAGVSSITGVEAERIIGMDVINADGKEVGEIKDLVLDQQQVAHAVVSVGGFLGIGAKDVAVPFEQLRVGQDNVTLMSESSESELKQMPEYKKDSYTRIERKVERAAPPARPMGDAGKAPLPKE